MSDFDRLIWGGNVVTESGVTRSDIGIKEGRILAVGPGVTGSARERIEATGLHIFPGLIDSHVHFNEPGRTHWEGIETGSRALAAGGGTLFFDMPLNAHPPTIDAGSFDQKLAAARASALTDFAFWGGLVPGNLEQLEALSRRGVIGFKAFMCPSGIEDFPWADNETLYAGMKRAAALGQIVAVHAESENVKGTFARQKVAEGKTTVRAYLDSRPIHAELEAIERALEMAGETGCALHIVHVSCGAGVALIASARSLGVNVSCETCPHYLALTEDDVLELGAIAKCAPPLRPKGAQDSLWKYVKFGQIATIGSDHSPSPPDLKSAANFFDAWGGISGIQHTLPILLTEGHFERNVALSLLAKLTSFNPAERFRLPPRKGRIRPGADADLAFVELGGAARVKADDLFYRHRHSAYVGRSLTGKVRQTMLRGQTLCVDGKIVAQPGGQFVRPATAGSQSQ